ncbi:MAG: GrpB family protein [Candidatus Thorarchaeota archaeon]
MQEPSEPVMVERYNPEWASWFEKLSTFFQSKLDHYVVRIEHVGSTSIPGMIAKPIIDFDVVIRMPDFDEVRSCLENIGYVHEGDLGIPEREAFALTNLKLKEELPPHHLYVCDINSKELHRHIAFRNYLRTHPDDATKYSEIKVQLVKKHSRDRTLYMDGKDHLVKELLEKALEWANGV